MRERPKPLPAPTEAEVEQSFKEHKKKRVKGEKSWEIMKASQKPWSEFNAIEVDGKRLDFGRQTNALRVTDKALARDIQQTLGGRPGEADVVVVEVDDVPTNTERTPRKSFIINAPWKKNE